MKVNLSLLIVKFRQEVLKRNIFSFGLELTLPYFNNSPTQFIEFGDVEFVTFNIPLDFCFPKIVIVDRDCREAAILVTVPKATVNEYGNLVLGKNDVGFAGQVLSVQPKAVAMCKQKASHQNFGFGVFAFDVRHTFLTLFFR